MKKVLYIILICCAGIKAYAQTPTVSQFDRLREIQPYLESSTNRLWFYNFNGTSYKWVNPLLASDSASTGSGYITLNYLLTHPFVEIDPLYTANGAKLGSNNVFTGLNTFNQLITATGGMTSGSNILPTASSSFALGNSTFKWQGSFINTMNTSSLKMLGAGMSIISAAGVTRNQIFENGHVVINGVLDSAYNLDIKGTTRSYQINVEALKVGGLVYTDTTNRGTLKRVTLGTGLNLTNAGVLSSTGVSEVMTTLGDIDYYTGSARARLAGNTSTTTKVLSSTGNGTISAAPVWITPSAGTVTNVSSANSDIGVATATSTPVLTLNNVNGVTKSYYDPTSSIQTQLNGKQGALTLTNTGTSGNATLFGNTLNIPNYSGGGGGGVSRLTSFYTDAAATTSTADAYSYTVPSNTLVSNGAFIEGQYNGIFTAGGNTCSMSVIFAGTSLLSTGTLTSGGSIRITIKAYKTGSSTARCQTLIEILGLTPNTFSNSTDLSGLDFTTTNILKLTQIASAGGGVLTFNSGAVTINP